MMAAVVAVEEDGGAETWTSHGWGNRGGYGGGYDRGRFSDEKICGKERGREEGVREMELMRRERKVDIVREI